SSFPKLYQDFNKEVNYESKTYCLKSIDINLTKRLQKYGINEMFKRKNVTKQLTEKITEKEFKKLKKLNEFIKSYYYCKKKKKKYSSFCVETKKITESLNSDILYKKKRSLGIILFEILFGSYIREEQYAIYIQIISELNQNILYKQSNPYSIYQLLMGRGKTS